MKFLTTTLFLLSSLSLFAQNVNINFLGRKTYQQDLSDVWGYAANGREYALVGAHTGMSIVDVTNPATPTELFFVTAGTSDWHDIAVWNGFAYITNEGGGGLRIADLNFLPDSIKTYTWTGGSLGLNTAHTVFADENGILYIAGGNNSAGRGLLMLDADSNATNPPLIGRYDVHYVHDVYVRGDTAWTAEINNGIFAVLDVSNKSAPVILATNSTPSSKTHNTWLSDDGRTLLTTDEVNNAYAASYDVSDLGNIRRLDLVQSNPGSGSVVHNIHYLGNFAVASYYRDGVVIFDATRPANLIEVGNYDTSPFSGGGFSGAWSVYPYLPSGNLLVSDIEQGLFVLGPTYRQACYLEGVVTDISNGMPVNNVSITIMPSNPSELSGLLGDYRTGILDSGTYTVQFLKAGYQTHIENNVVLRNGIVTTLNVQLIPAIPITLTGSVQDVSNGQKIPFSHVLIENTINSYQTLTDSNGDFTIDSFQTGIYQAYAGKWGYLTKQQNVNIFSATTVVVGLQRGYYDDFLFDFGWGTASTAQSGDWEHGLPIGTAYNGDISNPEADVAGDFGLYCFVTGNDGGDAGDDDVDDGRVTLTTPVMDLAAFNDPFITYSRWFFNDGGTNGGPNPDDSLIVTISNGTDNAVLETVTITTNGWIEHGFRVKDFVALSSAVTLSFETADEASSGHLVEAGVDLFFVQDSHFIITPEVNFGVDQTEGCPGSAFVFTDSSLNEPATWFWEFPGATPPSSTDSNPTVIYHNAGVYNITLSATNAGGTGSVTKNALVRVRENPFTQGFVNDASSGTASDGSITLAFSAGTPPYSVLWNTGSTSAMIDSLPPGDYIATVTDSFGCTTTDTFTVDINISVGGVQEVSFRMYPNPFSENVLLESSESVQITIFNTLGAEVDRIDLSAGSKLTWGADQKPGIYFAVATNKAQQKKVIRIVKSN